MTVAHTSQRVRAVGLWRPSPVPGRIQESKKLPVEAAEEGAYLVVLAGPARGSDPIPRVVPGQVDAAATGG